MYPIDDGQILFKKNIYRLASTNGGQSAHIEVLEVMQGESDDRFIARPVDHPLPMSHCKEEYYGRADTEEEALKLCLQAIKGVDKKQLFVEKDKT